MSKRVLVTTRSFRAIEGDHQRLLLESGCEIVNSPYDRAATAQELAPLMEAIDAAILGLDECSAEVIARAGRLRIIARYGVGTDKVDIDAATRAGVAVTITPGANTLAVAEHTLALMLALARHLPLQDRRTRQGQWSPVSGVELFGATLGVIGMGRIGREAARRARAFGMRIVYYDPQPAVLETPDSINAALLSIDELLEESDFVSLHLPLTDGTRHLIDARRLALMKPSAYLINTARGGLVDETALAQALREGRIAGAAFDVFTHEPPLESPLLALDNFIATPHSGSATRQTTLRMGLMAAQQVLAVLNGERPAHLLNPEVFESGKVSD